MNRQSTQIEVIPPAGKVVALPTNEGPHRWQKGQSGNPAGRPKESYRISDLAKEHTESALATLVDICNDKDAPPNARVSAAEALLNRAWGKAPVQIETIGVSGNVKDWVEMFNKHKGEVDALMAEARAIEKKKQAEYLSIA